MASGLWVLGAVVVAGLAWVFGSIGLRITGWLTMTVSLVLFASALGNGVAGLLGCLVAVALFLGGVVLWLAGHWLAAFKEHYYLSTVAQRILTRVGRGRLDPTRHWGVRVHLKRGR
ncbi:hypothetical protein [Streptomyces luteireticuli]|uniref:hypothetical protein n=1 Tax=Streptomyces luteireticuli TaxID=173858 RepID=UPI003557864E